MSQIVNPPYYYDAESRQIRKDIGDTAHPIAQVCNWSEDTDPTGQFIVTACNAHDHLVEALKKIVANDPYKQSSAGIIARAALTAAGV